MSQTDSADLPSVWEKLAPDVTFASGQAPTEKESPPKHPRLRRVGWIALNVVSYLIWTYMFARVFVGDIERWVLARAAPQFIWLLDFRVFGVLLFFSLALLLIRKKFAWVPIFVLFFPLILTVWMIPRTLYKRGSWPLAIGVVHVIVASVRGVRFTVWSATAFAFSALFILATGVVWLQVLSCIALGVLWTLSLWRALRYSVQPSRFVRTQRRVLSRLLKAESFFRFVGVDDQVRNPDVKTLDKAQSQQVITKLGFGLATYRGTQLWALELDKYRRSPASVIFGAGSVMVLLVQALATFTLINNAVFDLDPSQFSVKGDPSLATWAYYTFASLFVSEVSLAAPVKGLAAGISIAAGFSTAVVVVIVIAAAIFGYRQSRSDETANQEIARLRESADEFAQRLGTEYDMSVDELMLKVNELGWDLLGVMAYMARRIPDPGESDGAPPATGGA